MITTSTIFLIGFISTSGATSEHTTGQIIIDWTDHSNDSNNPISLVHPANSSLQICIKHSNKFNVTINSSGKNGLTTDIFDATTPTKNRETYESAPVPDRENQDKFTCRHYAPFLPGSVSFSIRMETDSRSMALILTPDEGEIYHKAIQNWGECEPENDVLIALMPLYTSIDSSAANSMTDLITAMSQYNESIDKYRTTTTQEEKCPDKSNHQDYHNVLSQLNEQAAAILKEGQQSTHIVRQEELTVLIEHIYLGAMRVGVSGTVGVPNNEWSARTLPTTEGETPQASIVKTDGGSFNAELVVSYTQFFTPQTETSTEPHSGVTLGLGVVDFPSTTIGLNSAYLGLDLGWRKLSVTPSLVLCRENHLAQGVSEGDWITSTEDIPLRNTWDLGFGLIVHAPIELFKPELKTAVDK